MKPVSVLLRWLNPAATGDVAGHGLYRAVAVLGVAALLSCAWQGGWLGMGGAAVALAVVAWARQSGAGAPAEMPSAAPAADAAASGRQTSLRQAVDRAASGDGAGVMVAQVVPVWSRQLLVTRGASDEGMGLLLSSFASISETLDQLVRQLDSFQPSAEPGALAHAIAEQRPALEALLVPLRRAHAQRDEMVAQLGQCATAVGRLQQLCKEVREVGRHTRLVAFNASIEANRGQRSPVAGAALGAQASGSQPVAAEVRALAERIGEICDQMDTHLTHCATTAQQGHRDGLLQDTAPDELSLEIELRAREALEAMMASLGTAMQGSADVQDSGRALREQLDEAFTHFQFGDRLAQMLQIIGLDMADFAEWTAQHPDAGPADARAWLQALEKKYTMDEQRAEHHGLQTVDRGTEVEFF